MLDALHKLLGGAGQVVQNVAHPPVVNQINQATGFHPPQLQQPQRPNVQPINQATGFPGHPYGALFQQPQPQQPTAQAINQATGFGQNDALQRLLQSSGINY